MVEAIAGIILAIIVLFVGMLIISGFLLIIFAVGLPIAALIVAAARIFAKK